MSTIAGERTEAPQTFEDLRTLISARYPDLSARLQQIAEFALQNPNDMALHTVAALAERVKVQPSALVRFAQALGFDGFSDMQRVFRSRLVDRNPSYAERLRRTAAGQPRRLKDPTDVLAAFTDAGIQALNHLHAELPPDALARAIERLAGAEAIHIVAQRRSFPVAAYLTYGLSHLGRRVFLIDGLGGLIQQQAHNIGANDTLLAVSFRPYAQETLDVVRVAKHVSAAVVAITDAPLSPLATLGDAVLIVEDAEVQGFRALTATMCLAVTLVVGLGQRLIQIEGGLRHEVPAEPS